MENNHTEQYAAGAIGEDVVCRLAKPRRKGLLALIFSRFMLIAVMLVLEAAIIISIYFFLYEHVKIIRATLTIFMVVMEIYLFNCDIYIHGFFLFVILFDFELFIFLMYIFSSGEFLVIILENNYYYYNNNYPN